MGRKLVDHSGSRFGRWLVLRLDVDAPRGAGIHTKWICVCDCGTEASVYATLLAGGRSRSCGCLQSEQVSKRSTKHGTYGTKGYWDHLGAIRRAKKFKATPAWADLAAIRQIYKNRPEGMHVDHIVPLNSPLVCGLHCEANLQYLSAKENCSKKNKIMEKYFG